MAGMKELAAQVKELEDQLVICIRCGMCQSVCPLFEQTRKESDVARGKLALLEGLMNNFFSDPDGVNQRLNKCLLCGSCAANCPSGVNAVEIFVKARAILTKYKGLSPVKKLIFKKMLANPSLFNRLTEHLGRFQWIFMKSDNNTQGTSCARLVSPLIEGRHILPVAKVPFHDSGFQPVLAPGRSGLTVVFFIGCIIDKIFPSIAQASMTVFKHHGVGVLCPENQGCCGIPALASGDRQSFDALVEHNLDLLKGLKFDYLLTACATCTSTIKKLWPLLYQGKGSGTRAFVREISEKTLDINQFLINRLIVEEAPQKNEEKTACVTYHDPCHLKKSLGVIEEPRKLIRAAGNRLVEMNGPDKCCGMGGSFNLYYYDISSSIGKRKGESIEDTGCDTVATGCPACMMQLSDMLAKADSEVAVKHPIELYAEHLLCASVKH
jgi:glycolate oxidase iron-sulfur subunit